jgi:hypothetical protein
MEFAPITYELWDAFVEERKCWEIVEIGHGVIATDRKRYIAGEAFVNPMDLTYEFTQETCSTRETAAYYIGLRSVQAALTKVGIIHADT